MGQLLDVIAAVYRHLGLDTAPGADVVFEQRIHSSIGDIPPAEDEQNDYDQAKTDDEPAAA